MTGQVQTDNAAKETKLMLRRYFLMAYHPHPPKVLDCCAGSGVLWKALKKEFPLASYCGLDLKPKKGRLQIASERFLAAGGWSADVVDVDTYGSPWKHWRQILEWAPAPVTVFLTSGFGFNPKGSGGGNLDKLALAASGLQFQTMKLPTSFGHKIRALTVPYCLQRATLYGWTIHEALETESEHAVYLGIRLTKPE